MIVEKIYLSNSEIIEECVVVIDILRAFTTAAFAFGAGTAKIIPVSTGDEAFALRTLYQDWLLMGEVRGVHIPGFDFSNSPSEIAAANNLHNRTLVQRTTAGTQGIVRSLNSGKILAASFTVASATLRRIFEIKPSKITLCITGGETGDEDLALADYLECRIKGIYSTSPEPFIQRVIDSPAAKVLASSENHEDIRLASSFDLFDFSMEVVKNSEIPMILKKENLSE